MPDDYPDNHFLKKKETWKHLRRWHHWETTEAEVGTERVAGDV